MLGPTQPWLNLSAAVFGPCRRVEKLFRSSTATVDARALHQRTTVPGGSPLFGFSRHSDTLRSPTTVSGSIRQGVRRTIAAGLRGRDGLGFTTASRDGWQP